MNERTNDGRQGSDDGHVTGDEEEDDDDGDALSSAMRGVDEWRGVRASYGIDGITTIHMVRMFGGSLKRARFCFPKGLVSLGREAGRSDHFQLPKRVMGTKKDGAGRSGRVYFFSLGTP